MILLLLGWLDISEYNLAEDNPYYLDCGVSIQDRGYVDRFIINFGIIFIGLCWWIRHGIWEKKKNQGWLLRFLLGCLSFHIVDLRNIERQGNWSRILSKTKCLRWLGTQVLRRKWLCESGGIRGRNIDLKIT